MRQEAARDQGIDIVGVLPRHISWPVYLEGKGYRAQGSVSLEATNEYGDGLLPQTQSKPAPPLLSGSQVLAELGCRSIEECSLEGSRVSRLLGFFARRECPRVSRSESSSCEPFETAITPSHKLVVYVYGFEPSLL